MCHNLGANYNLDPFVPSANIHGDKYQWGYKDPYIKQKDDVYQTGPVPGWNRVGKTNTWNNGIDDPCPSGYRVPSKEEWDAVLKYNSLERIGNWNELQLSGFKYTTGARLGDNLMLSTSGTRSNEGSTLFYDADLFHNVGAIVNYWSSTMFQQSIYGCSADAYNIRIFRPGNIRISPSINENNCISDAMTVRCIKNN